MPRITELHLSHFRNITAASIEPGNRINFIYGDNGAGKTSVLEAINLAAVGRSFRTRNYRRVIQADKGELLVRLALESDDTQSRLTPIGVLRKRNGDSLFKINGEVAVSSAELAVHLPLLLINSQSFSLLEGSAKERRQFFDWLVFHVKPEFRLLWKDYSRLLKQRNSLLRRDKIAYTDLYSWDVQLAEVSRRIAELREHCFIGFKKAVDEFVAESSLAGLGVWQIDYIKGWNEQEQDLIAQLKDGFERDRRYGYTTLGPHRSNLRLALNQQLAVDTLSRGQMKVLIVALYLSLARVFFKATGSKPVFLLDDLPSELDGPHIQRLGHWINKTGSQVFITGVSLEALHFFWPQLEQSSESIAAFHVKHGELMAE